MNSSLKHSRSIDSYCVAHHEVGETAFKSKFVTRVTGTTRTFRAPSVSRDPVKMKTNCMSVELEKYPGGRCLFVIRTRYCILTKTAKRML